jgi:hypothetical protein
VLAVAALGLALETLDAPPPDPPARAPFPPPPPPPPNVVREPGTLQLKPSEPLLEGLVARAFEFVKTPFPPEPPAWFCVPDGCFSVVFVFVGAVPPSAAALPTPLFRQRELPQLQPPPPLPPLAVRVFTLSVNDEAVPSVQICLHDIQSKAFLG